MWHSRCKQTIQELLASPVSPQTIRLVDDVSDTVRISMLILVSVARSFGVDYVWQAGLPNN